MMAPQDRRKFEALLGNEADMAFRRRALRLVEFLELRDGDDVLDCGCGMGFHLMAMGSLRRVRLTGVDGDEGRLAWARREGIRADLIHSEIERLPFADCSFDKILFSEVLEHLDNDVRGLRELSRVLRPGGVLALSVPHASYPFWWDPINRVWIALGGQPIRSGPIAGIWSNHVRLYSPEVLRARLGQSGFRTEVLEETTHYCFPFSHFIVYGIGKPLLEHNLLPGWARRSADRFTALENRGSLWNPLNLFLRLLRRIDRLNDSDGASGKRTFVNILVRARKPPATHSAPVQR